MLLFRIEHGLNIIYNHWQSDCHFHPILFFEGKAGAFQSGDPYNTSL